MTKNRHCGLNNSKQHSSPPLLVIITKCDELISAPSMLQEGGNNKPTTTLFSPVSVGYHLKLCVPITFYKYYHFLPTTLYHILWCAY